MRGAQLTWVNTPSERREKLEIGITTSGTNCHLVMSDLGRSLYLSSFLKHKNGKTSIHAGLLKKTKWTKRYEHDFKV